jgi:hypothetical protein
MGRRRADLVGIARTVGLQHTNGARCALPHRILPERLKTMSVPQRIMCALMLAATVALAATEPENGPVERAAAAAGSSLRAAVANLEKGEEE